MTVRKMTEEQERRCCRWLDAGSIDVDWAARRYGVTKQQIRDIHCKHRKEGQLPLGPGRYKIKGEPRLIGFDVDGKWVDEPLEPEDEASNTEPNDRDFPRVLSYKTDGPRTL